jgi:hypothetical protein
MRQWAPYGVTILIITVGTELSPSLPYYPLGIRAILGGLRPGAGAVAAGDSRKAYHGSSLLNRTLGSGNWDVLAEFTGKDVAGLQYDRLYEPKPEFVPAGDSLPPHSRAVTADYVSVSDGTSVAVGVTVADGTGVSVGAPNLGVGVAVRTGSLHTPARTVVVNPPGMYAGGLGRRPPKRLPFHGPCASCLGRSSSG